MPTVSRTALVAYSPAELFALVSDVEAYPQYLPFCVEARVLQRDENSVTAHMAFARAGVRQGVTTRNRHVAPYRLEMELIDGPFEVLRGAWDFQPLGASASKVVFTIEFEIASRLAHLAVNALVNEAAALAIDAFQKRAARLYGKRF